MRLQPGVDAPGAVVLVAPGNDEALLGVRADHIDRVVGPFLGRRVIHVALDQQVAAILAGPDQGHHRPVDDEMFLAGGEAHLVHGGRGRPGQGRDIDKAAVEREFRAVEGVEILLHVGGRVRTDQPVRLAGRAVADPERGQVAVAALRRRAVDMDEGHRPAVRGQHRLGKSAAAGQGAVGPAGVGVDDIAGSLGDVSGRRRSHWRRRAHEASEQQLQGWPAHPRAS